MQSQKPVLMKVVILPDGTRKRMPAAEADKLAKAASVKSAKKTGGDE